MGHLDTDVQSPANFSENSRGRRRGSYIFTAIYFYLLLFMDPLKQNKQVIATITELFMRLDNVSEHLPLNLRNSLSGGQKNLGPPVLESSGTDSSSVVPNS